ncbi:MAG: hypothetical protein GC136_04005 [Alphaproteobacteria bacterium]|nr:hypothetical protein [Alphaproteobacteria bacterium]
MKKLALLAASAVLLTAGLASAETITTQTTVKQKDMPDLQKVRFVDMDINHDGILSRAEVGETLFYLYDTDDNKLIDNIEIGKKRVWTFIPLEKKELTMIDFNDDGLADVVDIKSQDFAEFSMLARFDKDHDGLSAEEFLDMSILELDTNKSKVVEPEEWKAAYIARVKALSADQFRYNP